MFVSTGARAALVARRTGEFSEQYVRPLVAEARKLGISPDELGRMIIRGATGATARDGSQERNAAW